MSDFILLEGSIFTLHTTELLMMLAAAILTGVLLKLLFDKFGYRSKNEGAGELETELETLQSKFSAEMIKKEEESKLFQEEIKESEKKNFNLQLQYAKALNHIEKIKAGIPVDEEDVELNQGEMANQVLQNLYEKIGQQEENLLYLEQRLAQTEQRRNELELMRQQESVASADYKKRIQEQQQEEEQVVLKLQDQLREKEKKQKEYEEKMQASVEKAEQLQIQLNESGQDSKIEILQHEIQLLQNKLKKQEGEFSATELIDSTHSQKDELAVIRTEAERVSETIEQFRDHLTGIFRDTYSYEQLLSSNERLHQTISQLQQEKHAAEEQLAEFEQKHQTVLVEEAERNELIRSLQEQINEKQHSLDDLYRIKEGLQITVNELNNRLSEKERLSREMIHAVKDIESRFARMYSDEENGLVVSADDELKYR